MPVMTEVRVVIGRRNGQLICARVWRESVRGEGSRELHVGTFATETLEALNPRSGGLPDVSDAGLLAYLVSLEDPHVVELSAEATAVLESDCSVFATANIGETAT